MAQPGAVAVDDGETAITFGELIAQASALAQSLSELEAPIGILLPFSTQYIVAIVAMLLADKTYVPMDSSFPEKRNLRIVSHSGMTGVVVNEATAKIAHALDPSVRPIAIPQPEPEQVPYAPPAADAGRILTIFYTSGSTGEPKGVCHSEAGLNYDLDYFIDMVGLGTADSHSLLISPAMSSSNRDIFAPLLTGTRLAVIDMKRLGIAAALQNIHRQNVTVLHAVPSVFRALFGGADADAAGKIRVLRIGGDRVTSRDIELYRKVFPRSCRFQLGLGTTETRPYAGRFVDHDMPLDRPLPPVGFPLPGQHLTLVDEADAPVAPGEVGEIVVASPGLSPGYWRDEALTRERFVKSVRHPGLTEYHTGDFGRWLPDGMLEFIGRRDRQIKVRGNSVNLGGIEAIIGIHPAIVEAAVIGRTTGTETAPIAYCVCEPGSDRTEEIRAWCAAQLPPAFRPAEIIRIDALPKLASDKVDLVALERLDGDRVRSAALAAAIAQAGLKTDIVGQAWSELFGADAYLRDLPFEVMGGDSLQGMKLLLAIERRLDRHLPNDLLDGTTRPSELAARVAALGDAAVARDTAGRPTLILFPGLFGADFTMTRFARRLGEHFNVVLMDYRHAADDLLGPADPERTFAECESALEAAGRPTRLWVLGNSFGCRIAVEAARRLLARGIPVEFVAVIDGPTETAIAARNSKKKAAIDAFRPPLDDRITLTGGRAAFAIAHTTRFIANRLVNRGMHAQIHTLSALLSRLGLKDASLEARRVAMARARTRAFKNVLAAPLPMPLTLFVSTAPYSLSRYIPDLGWADCCSELRIIALPGNHIEILMEPASARIVDALAEAERMLRARAA